MKNESLGLVVKSLTKPGDVYYIVVLVVTMGI